MDARAWFTTLDPEKKVIPPQVFNHDTDKKNLQTLAKFRFGGGAGHGYLTAVGLEARQQLLKLLPALEALIYERIATYPPDQRGEIRRNFGNTSYTETEALWKYTAYSLVLESNGKSKTNPWKAGRAGRTMLDTPEAKERAKALLERGIRRQIHMLDLPEPESFVLIIDSIEPTAPVPAGGMKYQQLAVKVQFRLNAELKGPWHAGRLASKGAGVIRPYKA